MTRLRRPTRLLAIGAVSRAGGTRGASSRASSRTMRLGFIENLSSVLAAADVGVNPVMYGSGANCKVALYLSAGLPVLTSEVGLRGYEHLRDQCIVAELDEFADALAQLEPEKQARARPQQLADWSAHAAMLLRAYAALGA